MIAGHERRGLLREHLEALERERTQANRLRDLEAVERIDEPITVYNEALKAAGNDRDDASAIVTNIHELLGLIGPSFSAQRTEIAQLVNEFAAFARKPRSGSAEAAMRPTELGCGETSRSAPSRELTPSRPRHRKRPGSSGLGQSVSAGIDRSGWIGASRFDEAMLDCVSSQRDAISQAELLQDVGAVTVNRLRADNEYPGDLLRRVPVRDQSEDLKLSPR